MEKTLSITDFYRTKLNQTFDRGETETAHFNVFVLEDFIGKNAKPTPYSRRDFYKISLIIGRNLYYYADKTIEIEKNALTFANPQIPYTWESLDDEQSGFFCIFNAAFIREFNGGKLQDYPVFKPGGQPIYFLPDEQIETVANIFRRMFAELESDYVYKYDALKNMIFELIHAAQKTLQPVVPTLPSGSNAAARIAELFTELLESQFPVASPYQPINLRSANEFADQLAVHVNHLNRALKEATGKTTSELIAERLTQEAVVLLKHTTWNVAEIAHSLGFEEPAHFNNFFKKRTAQTPTAFRVV